MVVLFWIASFGCLFWVGADPSVSPIVYFVAVPAALAVVWTLFSVFVLHRVPRVGPRR